MDYFSLKKLDNTSLLKRIGELLTLENHCIVQLILLIMLLIQRHLHLRYGYSNAAKFISDRFSLTPEQAKKRLRIARAVFYFPQILEPLRYLEKIKSPKTVN